MDPLIRKSLRNGLYGFGILATISIGYGVIYLEIVAEEGFILAEFLLSLVGAASMSVLFAFLPVFLISLIIYKAKNKY